MKKHKRDPEHRSYVKGYQAAIQGRSLSVCPHQENTTIACLLYTSPSPRD